MYRMKPRHNLRTSNWTQVVESTSWLPETQHLPYSPILPPIRCLVVRLCKLFVLLCSLYIIYMYICFAPAKASQVFFPHSLSLWYFVVNFSFFFLNFYLFSFCLFFAHFFSGFVSSCLVLLYIYLYCELILPQNPHHH